jgi:hypothetical protein
MRSKVRSIDSYEETPGPRMTRELAGPKLEFVERRKAVRRRGNSEQGRALEILGHAVEYLVDSRLFLVDQTQAKAEQDAVQILMRMSRAVFLECPEVVSLWDKMGRLCRKSFARG